MSNIIAKLNAAVRKAKDQDGDLDGWRYTMTLVDADGIMRRLKSLIKSRDSYRTENYKLQKHAGRLKQEVDQKAGEIRELKERLQTAQASEIMEIANENLKRLEKYDAPNPKCNAGHVNTLPLKLWCCPMCTDLAGKKVVAADLMLEKADHAIGVCGLDNSLDELEGAAERYRGVK